MKHFLICVCILCGIALFVYAFSPDTVKGISEPQASEVIRPVVRPVAPSEKIVESLKPDNPPPEGKTELAPHQSTFSDHQLYLPSDVPKWKIDCSTDRAYIERLEEIIDRDDNKTSKSSIERQQRLKALKEAFKIKWSEKFKAEAKNRTPEAQEQLGGSSFYWFGTKGASLCTEDLKP